MHAKFRLSPNLLQVSPVYVSSRPTLKISNTVDLDQNQKKIRIVAIYNDNDNDRAMYVQVEFTLSICFYLAIAFFLKGLLNVVANSRGDNTLFD